MADVADAVIARRAPAAASSAVSAVVVADARATGRFFAGAFPAEAEEDVPPAVRRFGDAFSSQPSATSAKRMFLMCIGLAPQPATSAFSISSKQRLSICATSMASSTPDCSNAGTKRAPYPALTPSSQSCTDRATSLLLPALL